MPVSRRWFEARCGDAFTASGSFAKDLFSLGTSMGSYSLLVLIEGMDRQHSSPQKFSAGSAFSVLNHQVAVADAVVLQRPLRNIFETFGLCCWPITSG